MCSILFHNVSDLSSASLRNPLMTANGAELANLPCGKKVLASSAAKKAPCVVDKDLTNLMGDLNLPSAKRNLRALLIKGLEALKEGNSPISVWNDGTSRNNRTKL